MHKVTGIHSSGESKCHKQKGKSKNRNAKKQGGISNRELENSSAMGNWGNARKEKSLGESGGSSQRFDGKLLMKSKYLVLLRPFCRRG